MTYTPTILQRSTDTDQAFPWITYRASVARACRDGDSNVCAGCGCELDRWPVAHSPRCAEGKP